jgi:putative hydrolase of the HAD superfamily
MPEIIFFDLDDTLYPRKSGIMHLMGLNIARWVVEKLGIPESEAQNTRKRWRDTYGTALRGMIEENYDFDKDEFFNYVHDLPLDLIAPNPQIKRMIKSFPMRKAVLTNSNIEHARRVLKHIDLADCFEMVIDIKALQYINKPWPEAYERALIMMGGVAPHKAILVEDSPANTRTAKALGITTILVDCPTSEDAHYFVNDLIEVEQVISKLKETCNSTL